MVAQKTIFDTVVEEFLRRLDSDESLPDEVAARLRQLFLTGDLKVDSLQGAIEKCESKHDQA